MHRLDTDTSGCLLFARTAKARARFQKAFETRPVEKYYLAVVASEIAEERGRDRPAARQEVERRSRLEDGRRSSWARSGNALAAAGGPRGSTLVEFRPITGRTHQIRVHAREAFGRGIIGDRVYGVPGGPMLLHAVAAGRAARRKATIDVTAPVPDYFGEWADEA